MKGNQMVVALDYGTSACKGTVWTLRGERVAECSLGYPTYRTDGWSAEQDPDDWWAVGLDILTSLGKAVRGLGEVLAIGLSGPLGNLVAVDARGARVWPRSPIWQDRRAESVAAGIRSILSSKRLDAWLGTHLPPAPSWPIERLWWLKATYPEQWDAISILAPLKDYIGFRLTGRWVTDASSWRGLLHLPDGAVVPPILDALALPATVIPPRGLPESSRGHLLKDIARRVGLSSTVEVTVGWNDLNTAALGADLRLGEGFDLAGTSDHLGQAVSDPERLDPALAFVPWTEHIVLYYGVTAVSGGSVLWAKQWLGIDSDRQWQRALTEAAALPPGAQGLLFLPYLSGARAPEWDPSARGAFLGLTERHQSGAGLLAVMEGVAYQLRSIYERISPKPGDLRYLKATGGPTEVALWNQVKADVLGVPLWVANYTEGSSVGAVRLAVRMLGEDETPFVPAWTVVTPRDAQHRAYDRGYRCYRQALPSLHTLFQELAEQELAEQELAEQEFPAPLS